MNLSTRISLGYALVIGVLFAMLAYQSSVIYELQSANRELTRVSFAAADLSRELRQTLAALEEFTRKFAVTLDLGYRQQIRIRQERFESELAELENLSLAVPESNQIRQLRSSWNRYRQDDFSAGTGDPEPADVARQIEGLRTVGIQITRVREAIQQSIFERVRQITRRGERTEWMSLAVVAGALLWSVGVALVMVRSTSRRFRQLTQGTRALARGNFEFRLPVEGGDELSRLSRNFNAMAERLTELERLKRDFLSHVSHELKTPLGSIQESHRLLLDEIPGPLTADQRRLLELNLQGSRRLASMIRNLLDVSRIEAGGVIYRRSRCHLRELVESAVAELKPLLQEKGQWVRTRFQQGEASVLCDPDAMLQVLLNLLENASKFSAPETEIGVEVDTTFRVPPSLPAALAGALLTPPAFVWLKVRDRGPGVPASQREQIFEKFQQGGEGTRKPAQGVGLGLAICRSIVEAHGGAVWVDAGVEGGSVFSVLLPAGP